MHYFESESADHASLVGSTHAKKQRDQKIGIFLGTLTATVLLILVIGAATQGGASPETFAFLKTRQDAMRNKGYYKLEQTAQSASEAAAICAASGGQLATIDTSLDLVAASKECSSTKGCYIGLARSPRSGIHVWIDGSPMVVQNWVGGKGDKLHPCVELIGSGSAHGKWKGIACMGLVRPPLCMQRNKMYYRVPGMVSSSSEYNALCRSSGGEMAVILNAEENAAAVKACGNKKGCWIGMARDPVSYHFIWLDGTGVCFQNWAPKQPTLTNKEGCAMIDSKGGWSDLPCAGQKLGALCETKW